MMDKVKRLKEIINSKKESGRYLKEDNFEWTQQGITLYELGKYKEALKAFDKSLSIKDDDVIVYTHKGDTLCKLGEYEESLSCYKKALYIEKKQSEPDNPRIAEIKTHVAKLYDRMGKYDEALKNYEEAIGLIVNTKGSNNIKFAKILVSIARTHKDCGKNKEALNNYKKALKVLENVLGFSHPEVAAILVDIADVYKSEENNEKAISYYKDAQSIYKNIFGYNNLETAKTLKKIAEIYKNTNDYEKAISTYQDALGIIKEILGQKHIEAAKIYRDLAEICIDSRDYKNALSNYMAVLKIFETEFRTENLEVAKCLSDIAFVYKEMEMYEEAISVLTRIISIYEKFPAYENQIAEISNKILEYSYINKRKIVHQYTTPVNIQSRDISIKEQQLLSNSDNLSGQLGWEDLHSLAQDEDSYAKWRAASLIGSTFPDILNKREAWNDLIKLSNDNDINVQRIAVSSLIFASQYLLEKQKVWNDLNRLIRKQEDYLRYNIARGLISVFPYVPNKEEAWEDLYNLVRGKDEDIQYIVISSIGEIFRYIPDRQQAWEILHHSIKNGNEDIQFGALFSLTSAFMYLPEKKEAWKDLITLARSKHSNTRKIASSYLLSAFEYIENKKEAWNDLVELTSSADIYVKRQIMRTLGLVFSHISDKQKAWEDLHKLTNDKDNYVKWGAASSIGSIFAYIPDKQRAWEDLHKLTKDENSYVKMGAVSSIGSIFADLPDKQQAWEDLHKLTNDEDSYVKLGAVSSIGSIFADLPDKQQAWEDLHRLTKDEDSYVKWRAASSIGSAFEDIPNKQRAWEDLHALTRDENNLVRVGANHALGRICIYNASQSKSENLYISELKKAINFFKKSSEDSVFYNPSNFCLPFYRTFYTIISSKKKQDNEEVNKYLIEAKNSIEGSENKKLLFEAVENLAEALREVQNLGNLDLQAIKDELNFYRKYCDQAAELMKDTDENAPFATEVLRKGLPILDRNLKKLLEEIQERAKTICREAKGTPVQEIACAVNKEVQKWEIINQEEMTEKVYDLVFTLKSKIPDIPENRHILEKIEGLKHERNILDQYNNLTMIIASIPLVKTVVPSSLETGCDSNTKPTIGIITSLPMEYFLLKMILENPKSYEVQGKLEERIYSVGEIPTKKNGRHSIVLSLVGMNNITAASNASLIIEQFPTIKHIFVVGIAGSISNPIKGDDQVRLGDIVVSNVVIRYDITKQGIQEIIRNPSSDILLNIVRHLEAEGTSGNRPWEKYIDQYLSKLKITRPSEKKDILYNIDNKEETIQLPENHKRIKGQPSVFIEPIASANILQKDPQVRDKLRDKFGVKAVEMEASGIADATWNHEVGYLVVRGICDYCDYHKNDEWQQYAAIVAAAYTRALIESMP